jgi:hypothetical protein
MSAMSAVVTRGSARTVPALYLALDSFEGRVRGRLGRAAA